MPRPRSRRKPTFVRQESWRYKRLKPSWRRPRGKSSRMRRRIRGWPPIVKIGYGEKKTLRGLHPSGLKEVLVHNLSELAKIDPKVGAARISHTIGEKKRIAILEKAREMGVKVLNPGLKREGAESEAVAETLPLPSEPAKEEALKT